MAYTFVNGEKEFRVTWMEAEELIGLMRDLGISPSRPQDVAPFCGPVAVKLEEALDAKKIGTKLTEVQIIPGFPKKTSWRLMKVGGQTPLTEEEEGILREFVKFLR